MAPGGLRPAAFAALVMLADSLGTASAWALDPCPPSAESPARVAWNTATQCSCSAASTSSGSIWGTGYYSTDSSICKAARHAGVIPDAGGDVRFRTIGARSAFLGTTRNGIASLNYAPPWDAYQFGSFYPAPGPSPAVSAAPDCPADARYLAAGATVKCGCAATALSFPRNVWGSGVYTNDSGLCKAAVHAGVIPSTGGVVTFKVQGARSSYRGTTARGIATYSYGFWGGSYEFVNPGPPETALSSCSFGGQLRANGAEFNGYTTSSVPYGNTCVAGALVCNNGLIANLATYPYGSCTAQSAPVTYSLSLQMTRLPLGSFHPFMVTVTLKANGAPAPGKILTLKVPKGTASAVTDKGDGTYLFVVTPSSTGAYPVTVSYGGASISRTAVVLDSVIAGAGQPMAVPGSFVNTSGYEDGITITPDGKYLFLQYGPFHLSGLFYTNTICASPDYSMYDLVGCLGRPGSALVFNTRGPYSGPLRPRFPARAITAEGKLRHLPSIVIPGVAKGLAGWPTVFYGFKKQADGTFAEPFKVAFNDERAVNGPFGLSFKMNGDGTAQFLVAWQNHLNDLAGDDKAKIYTGQLTLGQDFNLGEVTYQGDAFASITPNISPLPFAYQPGVQGNPHLHYDSTGAIRSIWTDDESDTHDISVYRLVSGGFPGGAWVREKLPDVINTADEDRQPFFDGNRLILQRGGGIVQHAYLPSNGNCAGRYSVNDCWGPAVTLVSANGNSGPGQIFIVGEPTVAVENGKKFLYFVYMESNVDPTAPGFIDFNGNAGFVEIP